ncbi:MAG TPA: HEAT repeat domain-containing protein [Candidatus Binatia bacterium]|nr:HEAT repeat domain-containing protein [Candidatus Binatia bacterium]
MGKATLWVLVAAGVLLAGFLTVQHQSNCRVASELAALREELAGRAPEETAPQQRVKPNVGSDNAVTLRRLDALEETVARSRKWAQSSQDPFERAKLMKAFTDATKRPTAGDAVLVPALVQGLQDNSPFVREPAVLGLAPHAGDPTVQKWLRWTAENDMDPGVRRTAANAVMNPRR